MKRLVQVWIVHILVLMSYLVPVVAHAQLTSEKLVFTSDRAGNQDIYLLDGGSVIQLTSDLGTDNIASLSSDGIKIVWYSNRTGDDEIYSMRIDGSNLKQLTSSPGVDQSPSWSPDGSKIAFSTIRDGNWEIYVMNADGSNPVNVSNHSAADDQPAWSPDGSKIAFVSTRDGGSEIYVMNADGSNQIRLTHEPAHDENPHWSPDGNEIAFGSERDGNWEIYVMNSDGSNPVNLTQHPAADTYPSWSPDGTKIAFASERSGNSEVWVMDINDGIAANLTQHPSTDGAASFPAGIFDINRFSVQSVSSPYGYSIYSGFWTDQSPDDIVSVTVVDPDGMEHLVPYSRMVDGRAEYSTVLVDPHRATTNLYSRPLPWHFRCYVQSKNPAATAPSLFGDIVEGFMETQAQITSPPTEDAVLTTGRPVFRWEAIQDPSVHHLGLEVWVLNDQTGSWAYTGILNYDIQPADTAFSLPANTELVSSKKYRLHVLCYDQHGNHSYIERTFRVDPAGYVFDAQSSHNPTEYGIWCELRVEGDTPSIVRVEVEDPDKQVHELKYMDGRYANTITKASPLEQPLYAAPQPWKFSCSVYYQDGTQHPVLEDTVDNIIEEMPQIVFPTIRVNPSALSSIKWQPVTDDRPITHYKVEVRYIEQKIDLPYASMIPATQTEYPIRYTFVDGEYYEIRVYAFDAANNHSYTVVPILVDATQETPPNTGQFQLTLTQGLNMMSLPVQPETPYTAMRLAEELGATVVIRLDADTQKFMPHIAGVSQGDGFPILGGAGYIVNVLTPAQVTFTGTVWSNAAPELASQPTVWAFAVAGQVETNVPPLGYLVVTVKSPDYEWEMGQRVWDGFFTLATVDSSRRPVVSLGDILEIRVEDSTGHLLSEQQMQVTERMLREARVVLPPLRVHTLPQSTRLLPNFPNPCNPETWIPFTLAAPGEVVLRVFDAQGREVRRFDLGHRPAGWYDSRTSAIHWDGRNAVGESVSSGIYWVGMETNNVHALSRLMLVK